MNKNLKTASILIALFGAVLILVGCPQPTTNANTATDAETRSFWVDNNIDNPSPNTYNFVQIQAELAYQTDRCNVWVRNNSDKNLISADLLKSYGDYFTDHSWPEVTSYVNKPTNFFGEPGDRINILFYLATDDFAGMFWEKDFYSDADVQAAWGCRSNETNIFYMNIDSAISAKNQAYATTFTKGTLSHEFQHMCNAHYFIAGGGKNKERQMDSWANEFCSTTTESIFADQYSIYVPSLNADAGTAADRKAYSRGETDFLYWDNDFTQYTTASLLGGYILSQLPAANRPAFIRTFLKDTFTEDLTPTSYSSSQVTTTYRSSVEDLILTLQDSAVDFKSTAAGQGWIDAHVNDSDNSGFAADWAIVMKGFVSALTGTNQKFNDYLKDVTSAENKAKVPAPSIPLAAASTTSVPLKASAFVVGRTKVGSLSSDKITDATTSASAIDAYVIVWNGLIPSPATIAAADKNLPAGTATFGANVLLKPDYPAPASRNLVYDSGFRFDRTNSRPAEAGSVAAFRGGSLPPPASRTTPIPGTGANLNPSDGGGGYLSCAYVGVAP